MSGARDTCGTGTTGGGLEAPAPLELAEAQGPLEEFKTLAQLEEIAVTILFLLGGLVRL